MMGELVKVVLLTCTSFLNVALIAGLGEQPDQGFFLVSHPPALGRRGGDLYIYAIQTDVIYNDGESEINYEGDPRYIKESGPIIGDGREWGSFLNIGVPNRNPGCRFGQYNGVFTPSDLSSNQIRNGQTYVRQASRFLSTGGMYTVTVYPDSVGGTSLSEKTSIGVGFAPGCPRIRWCKGNQNNYHTGPRLILSTIEDGGLYTIQRPRRGRRGYFSQIKVFVAACPEGMWDNKGTCQAGVTCQNGGVLRKKLNDCVCPPYFSTYTCNCVVEPRENGDQFVLGDTRGGDELSCSDLPGGNENCKGMLICYLDLYGCKCAPGWRGEKCDRPCPVGRYGPDCTQVCPESEPKCSRFFGPSTNLRPGCS